MEDLHTKTLGKLLKGVEGKKYPHGRHPDFSKEKEIYKNSKSKALSKAKEDDKFHKYMTSHGKKHSGGIKWSTDDIPR
jgi:hypothetical protein